MKLSNRELLDTLSNKRLTKDMLLEILNENKRKAGFEGVVAFDEKHLSKYRVKAIRFCQKNLTNRCTTEQWLKSHDEKFCGRRVS